MNSRALVVLDAGSVESIDRWAWQFTAFLSRYVSPSVPIAEQFIDFDVHDAGSSESIPRLRSSPTLIDQPLSWARYVDFITRVRNSCPADDTSGDRRHIASATAWKMRMKSILQKALVEHDWGSEGGGFDEDDDGAAGKKTIAIFTAVPISENPRRDSFREDGLKEKLKELHIRLLFVDLSENLWEPLTTRSKSSAPPGLLNSFLREVPGSLLNLMPQSGGECPRFPVDLKVEPNPSLRTGSTASTEDTLSDDLYLNILTKAHGSPYDSHDETTTDVEEMSETHSMTVPEKDAFSPKAVTVSALLPGCHEARRLLCDVKSSSSMASGRGKAFLRIGGCPDFDRNEMNDLLEMDKSWEFSLTNEAQFDIRNDVPMKQSSGERATISDDSPAKQLIVGKTAVWIFHFNRGEDGSSDSGVCGIACPVRPEHVQRVLKDAVMTLLQSPTLDDDVMSMSTVVSSECKSADAFMSNCLRMLKKNDGTSKQKQPTKEIEQRFISKFRNGQCTTRTTKTVRRADLCVSKAETQVQLRLQEKWERKSGKRLGEPGSSRSARGGRNRKKPIEPLSVLLEKLKEVKFGALTAAEDGLHYASTRNIVKTILSAVGSNCIDHELSRRSAFETIQRHFLLDLDAISEQSYETEGVDRSVKDISSLRLQEMKFQVVLRLEVMAALLARKDEPEIFEKLGEEVGAFLDKMTRGAQGSSQIRPFLIDLLVPKYINHHGALLADLCSDFNVAIPQNLARFMSPTSTDEDVSNSASFSDNVSEASRDSGPSQEQGIPVMPAAPSLAANKAFRRISMPKRKKSQNDEPGPSFESAFGAIRGREARRSATAVGAAVVANLAMDKREATPTDGQKFKRNLFGTAQAPLDPVFRKAMRHKRKYEREMASPRTPPKKRSRSQVLPSPQWAYSPRLRSRTKNTPGQSRLQDVPETPESAADPDENVVQKTPIARPIRNLRFQGSEASPRRRMLVRATPKTPGTPSLFEEDRPGPVPSKSPAKEVSAADGASPVHVIGGSPVIPDFWDSVKSPTTRKDPVVTERVNAASKSLFMSPSTKNPDPDAVAMPPPTWTPSRSRTSSAKKRGAAYTSSSAGKAAFASDAESSPSPRVTLSPINMATLDEQTNFPSPKMPLSQRKGYVSGAQLTSPFRETRSNSSSRSSASKRLAL